MGLIYTFAMDKVRKNIEAALELLDENSTTFDKFESIRTLLKGLNPKIDSALSTCSKQLKHIENFQESNVIDLTAENLPEQTPEQKKRKKAILLLLRHWNELKDEVERVQKELDSSQQSGNSHHTAVSTSGKILGLAKGPLGITTIIAVAAVVILQTISVKVAIKNVGCDPINLGLIPIPLPGLSLPKAPIAPGAESVASLPPLNVTIDGTIPGKLTLSTIGLSKEFELDRVDIKVNGKSLAGQKTPINLGSSKRHSVVATCS